MSPIASPRRDCDAYLRYIGEPRPDTEGQSGDAQEPRNGLKYVGSGDVAVPEQETRNRKHE